MASETEISLNDAREKYGIVAKHGIMPTNGEKRFRLIHNGSDTAYIRTETSLGEFGWQNSHYHKSLMETYIVQTGWIGYSEFRDNQVALSVFRGGAVFTTVPYVVHNIFMPRASIIHTVKHGISIRESIKNSDWWDDLAEVKDSKF